MAFRRGLIVYGFAMLYYATFWQRLGAFIVDALVLWPVLSVNDVEFVSLGVAWSVSASVACVAVGYVVIGHALFGKTLGKWVVGIRVVKLDGAHLGWKTAWLRSSVDVAFQALGVICLSFVVLAERSPNAAGLAALGVLGSELWSWLEPAVLLWGISEVIVMLFNEERRAIHDFIASTMVVQGRSARPGGRRR